MAQLSWEFPEWFYTAEKYAKEGEALYNQGTALSDSISWLWGGTKSPSTLPPSGGTPPPSYQTPFSIEKFFKDYGLYIGLGIGGIIILKSVLK